jgi:hypothetical protein
VFGGPTWESHQKKGNQKEPPYTMMTGKPAKRSFDSAAVEQEYYVDDLTIAAQFAVAQPVMVPQMIINNNHHEADEHDDNEIDLASSSSSTASPPADTGSVIARQHDVEILVGMPQGGGAKKEEEGKNDEEEENDDPDDRAVQRRALDQMLEGLDSSDDDGEDEENALSLLLSNEANNVVEESSRKKPLSKNEIDVYDNAASSLVELQKRLHWNLEIGNVPLPAADDASSWAIAGHIRQHVVLERTLVILSEAVLGGSTLLLEEGTLLALRPTTGETKQQLPRLIPLGKILEVFGPVSRPLYSLRLISFDTRPTSSPDKGAAVVAVETSAASTNGGVPVEDSTKDDDSLVDPWGPTGLFTQYLSHNPNLPVYFLHRGTSATTKLLDRAIIYKNSRRGCDASNLYDEEIDQTEMEYSDDEQERRAKPNRRGGRGGGAAVQRQQRVEQRDLPRDTNSHRMVAAGNNNNNNRQNNYSNDNTNNATMMMTMIPQGFHRQAPPPPPHAVPFRSQQQQQQQQQQPPSSHAFFQRQQQFASPLHHVPVVTQTTTTPIPFPNTAQQQDDDDDDTEYYDFS